jgi:hypothetical protein
MAMLSMLTIKARICVHVKCKSIVTIMWNILKELNFTSTMAHVYQTKSKVGVLGIVTLYFPKLPIINFFIR